MSYKVMGITAGRKNSNSEILLKEALLACQNQGAQITMINLHDYNILDCTGCTVCTHAMSDGKELKCSLEGKDDKKAIMDVLLQQDALIFSVPTYELMASATFLKFMHRNLGYTIPYLEATGRLKHIDRVGALIAVGGSTLSWQSMALESMQAACITSGAKIVDMFMATRVPAPKHCLLHDDLIKRAEEVGNNIMQALHTPVEERKWLGDENMGWCPNCHSNALILGQPRWDGLYFPIECQVCGAGGDLEKTEDGKWKFVLAENGLCRDRTSAEGGGEHMTEITATQGGFYTEENLNIVQAKFEKYKKIQFPTI